jgi:hypothetical protein
MNTRIFIAAAVASFITPIAFGQGMSAGYSQPQSQPPQASTGGSQKSTTTTTRTNYPQGVKGYLDQQLAMSKDKKFHVALNGSDVALTPLKFHQEQKLSSGKASTAVDMKGVDGKIYEIEFVTSNGQVTGAKVGKINGKAP